LSFIGKAIERVGASMRGEKVELRDAMDQTEQEKALVGFVRSRLEDARTSSARLAQEGINLTNTAYLCGFDSVYYDGNSRSFKPIPSPSRFVQRNRVHVNRILPTAQNRLARLCKNPPRYDVRPKSSDEEDKDAARLGEQVLEQLWDTLAINRKRIPLTMWVQQCGIAYFKISWDPTLGTKRVMRKEAPEGEAASQEQAAPEYDVVAEGDLRADVCSFFEIFPDPLAKSWDELRYLTQAKIRPIDYFRNQYERGELVKSEDCWLNSLSYEMRINSLTSSAGAMSAPQSQMKDSAIECSYYERSSKSHPYGRHIITANGVLLKDDVLPIDEIPFVKFDDIVVGGKFNAEAIITHLRPLQDQLNKGKTMRAAFLNRMLTGKMLYARGHNLAEEAGNDQSGEWLAYDSVPNTPEPHALQMPTIPQYAYQEEDTLKLDMDDTAGINQASRGQMPSAQIPAIGMQLLVEQDDTRIGIETEAHEHSYADLGRIQLKFVGEYYKTDRLLKIAGENQEYLVKNFKGEDIRENFHVKVARGSTLPGSKVLKRQEIMNLRDNGYFGNPQDPRVSANVLRMLEYGDEKQAWKTQSLRLAQIQRGIKLIEERGEKPAVSEFDDHPLWLQEFDNYRISEKFINLDDQKKSLVLDVMNEHTEWLKELTMPQSDPMQDPELQTTTAAQDHEQELSQDIPPGAPPAPGMPEPAIEGGGQPLPQGEPV